MRIRSFKYSFQARPVYGPRRGGRAWERKHGRAQGRQQGSGRHQWAWRSGGVQLWRRQQGGGKRGKLKEREAKAERGGGWTSKDEQFASQARTRCVTREQQAGGCEGVLREWRVAWGGPSMPHAQRIISETFERQNKKKAVAVGCACAADPAASSGLSRATACQWVPRAERAKRHDVQPAR